MRVVARLVCWCAIAGLGPALVGCASTPPDIPTYFLQFSRNRVPRDTQKNRANNDTIRVVATEPATAVPAQIDLDALWH